MTEDKTRRKVTVSFELEGSTWAIFELTRSLRSEGKVAVWLRHRLMVAMEGILRDVTEAGARGDFEVSGGKVSDLGEDCREG